jgi:hypothetical protein
MGTKYWVKELSLDFKGNQMRTEHWMEELALNFKNN